MIYNIDKTELLDTPDLNLGYLKDDILVINYPKVDGRAEEGHYEIIAEYPETNGKEVIWVVDEPAIIECEAHTEEIPIKVYIPYTDNELESIRLNNLLREYNDNLHSTDSLILSYVEGFISDEEFEALKKERNEIRIEISLIEKKLSQIVK